MNTIYFLNDVGGVKIRPTSIGDKYIWTKWYINLGYYEVTREEYYIAKKLFSTNPAPVFSDNESEE